MNKKPDIEIGYKYFMFLYNNYTYIKVYNYY